LALLPPGAPFAALAFVLGVDYPALPCAINGARMRLVSGGPLRLSWRLISIAAEVHIHMRLKDKVAIVVGAGQSPGEGMGNGPPP
jgi:hypothetical protein